MTILQLKYVVTLSNSASMREASGKLFISQPALSAAIRELDDEIGTRIFERTNKGIKVTEEGSEFLEYAKQALNQYEILEQRYLHTGAGKDYYTVSMQHYVFAIHAFVRAVQARDSETFSYLIKETRTNEVLQDVRDYKSEIGVLAYSESHMKVLKKLLREYDLEFHPLMVCDTYAYLSDSHPLAGRSELSVEDLRDYPCITFDQSSESEFYLPEEALSGYDFPRRIRSNDRATSCELMIMLNGFAIGTGIMIASNALTDRLVSIKLKEEDPLTIGYIVKKKHALSELGKLYVAELEQIRDMQEQNMNGSE